MHYPIKLLSFVTLSALFTTVDVAASQPPTQRQGFSESSGFLLAQSNPTGNVLLEVEGVLEEGDLQANNDSLYDV